jgi:hypothetical protein
MVVVALFGSIAGCGGGATPSDPREGPLEALHTYQDASIDRDAKTLCSMFTGAKKRQVIAGTALIGGASGCEASVKKAMDIEGADDLAKRRASRKITTIANIAMKGSTAALVSFPSGQTLPLVKVGDDWLVNAPSS